MFFPKNILALEDDRVTGTLLEATLSQAGHSVRWVERAEMFFQSLKALSPDIVIVDNVPDSRCRETCAALHEKFQHQLPRIIVYSGSESEDDILSYYENGADDYISKRYSPKVLLGRIEALGRLDKVESHQRKTLCWDGLVLDASSKVARLDGKSLLLTPSEFELIYLLVSRSGKVFSRREIIGEMRNMKFSVSERTVDVFITCLRKKLGTIGSFIKTVRGVGYTFRVHSSDVKVVEG